MVIKNFPSIGLVTLACALIVTPVRFAFAQESGVTPSASATEQVSEAALQQAREQFGLGVAILQREVVDYQQAYDHFRLAYQISRSWKVLGNLGLCAFQLERYGEALPYYAQYLLEGADDVSPEEAASVRAESQLILERSGLVSLVGDGSSLEIVDTRTGSLIAAQTYQMPDSGFLELRLMAGSHELVATDSSGHSAILQLEVVAGESLAGHFSFAMPDKKSSPSIVTGVSALEGLQSLQLMGLGMAAAGTSSLLYAMGLNFIAVGRDRRGRAQCNFESSRTICEENAQADFSAQAQYLKKANIFLAIGGVAAATGLGLVVFGGGGGGSEPGQAQLEIIPYAGPTMSGLMTQGHF